MPPFYRAVVNKIPENNFLQYSHATTQTANNACVFLSELWLAGPPVCKWNTKLQKTVVAGIGTLTTVTNVTAGGSRLFFTGTAPANRLVKSDDGTTFSDLKNLNATARSIAANNNDELLITYTTGRRSWSDDNGNTLTDVIIAGNATEFNCVKWLPLHGVFVGANSSGYFYGTSAQVAANLPNIAFPGSAFLTFGETSDFIFGTDTNSRLWKTTDLINWTQVRTMVDTLSITFQQNDACTYNDTLYTTGSRGSICKYNKTADSFETMPTGLNVPMGCMTVFNDKLYAYSVGNGFALRSLVNE